MIIDLPRFLASARPAWAELESLLDRLQEQPDRKLTLDEAKRFHLLYQRVGADLVQVNTFASEPQLRRYLEALVARAYGEMHETRERGVRLRPLQWFARDFPAAFRRRWVAFIFSVSITALGMLFGGLAVAVDEEAKWALLPGQFAPLMNDPAKRVAEEEAASAKEGGSHATFAGQLMVNNIRVSINALALGMTWGIGTLVVLFYNGVLLGLVSVDYIRAGQSVFLMGWLLPHGIIEIPAILIAGQGGLVLGGAILGRGARAPLAERLRSVAGDVTHLIGGVAVLLVWAGIVEAFVSQWHAPVLPYWLKIAFGVIEGLLLVWLLRGRFLSRP